MSSTSNTTASPVDRLLDGVVGREGGYSNHPSDRGGETMWGITAATARRYGYTGAMQSMPRSQALRIYKERYLVEPGIIDVIPHSLAIANELFDTGVNMGVAWPGVFLQRSLNALNRRQRDYANVLIDGDIGPDTLRALSAYLRVRKAQDGEAVLLKALNILQGGRYFDITPEDAANEDFFFGWLRARIGALS